MVILNVKVYNEDITKIDMDKFEEVPVVIGGPHCQDFSVQNSKRTWDSAKNQLVFKFIEVVKKVKAKVFLILMFYKKLKLPNTES